MAQLLPLVSVFFAVAASAGAQSVWVVDASGGPGTDFLDVDPAVSAAAPGDTLLLRNGSYTDLVVNAKPLTVIAELGHAPQLAGGSIRNLAAGQFLVLSGLTFTSPIEGGLQIKGNQGSVWVEACVMTGADGDGLFTSPLFHAEGYGGAEIANSSAVHFASCVLSGGDGDDYAPLLASPGNGGPAALVSGSSNVAFYGCTLIGGDAGDVFDDDAAWSGPNGGAGLLISAGESVLVGSHLIGGAGGMGGEDFDPWIGYSCGSGGDGGAGVEQLFSATPPTVHLAAIQYTPGAPGPPYPGAGCSSGSPGTLLDVTTATVDFAAIDAFELDVTTPVRGGQPLHVTATGPPATFGFALVSGSPTWSWDGLFPGLGLVDLTAAKLFSLGTLPATPNFMAPSAIPAGGSQRFVVQLVGFDLSTALITFGEARSLVLLDPAL